MKSNKKIIGAGVFTAIAASLCCITPVLALISGASGVAASFSWLEPFRPYLIGITLLVIGFAWYLKIKPSKEVDCDCDVDEKPNFFQSKLFLGIVTCFAILMLAFPYYSNAFYPKNQNTLVVEDSNNANTIRFDIKGMTCSSCEEHVNHSVNQLNGIISITSSYEKGNAEIEYDNSLVSIKEIEDAVNSTGYTVTSKSN